MQKIQIFIPKNTFISATLVSKKITIINKRNFSIIFGRQNSKYIDFGPKKSITCQNKKKLAKRYDTNCCKSFYEEKSFGCNSFLSSMNFVCVMSHFVNHPNICTQ